MGKKVSKNCAFRIVLIYVATLFYSDIQTTSYFALNSDSISFYMYLLSFQSKIMIIGQVLSTQEALN